MKPRTPTLARAAIRCAALAAALLSLTAPARAQTQPQSGSRACMIEAPIQALGAPTTITDCLQGRPGVRRAVVKERCEGIAWGRAGGMGRQNEVDLIWLSQCPKQQADAVCRGAFDGEVDLYHYDRNEAQLAALEEECDGQWQQFDH
ncbi:MAG: hypothetical protein ACTTJV_08590 [Ottowia sp.]